MAIHIRISQEDCIACELCVEMCPTTPCVFQMVLGSAVVVHQEECEQCMLCVENCPTTAIHMGEKADEFLSFD